MDHADHVRLIEGGVDGFSWADLGSGRGAFTLALIDLLGTEGRITSVDRDRTALRQQAVTLRECFPDAQVEQLEADFRSPLPLRQLDGIVMANSLHFVKDQRQVLELVRSYLKPGGRLVLVEYNADRGNPWVPHPVSYGRWERLSEAAGFEPPRLLGRRPSRFLGEIYSAVSASP